jgi:hypothetical protein
LQFINNRNYGIEWNNIYYEKRVHEIKSNTKRLNRDLLLYWPVTNKGTRGKRGGGGKEGKLNATLCQHPKLRTTLTAKMYAKSVPNLIYTMAFNQ